MPNQKNKSSAVERFFHENPFNYHQFHVREIRIIQGGRAIISSDTVSPCIPSVISMKAMLFIKDFPALPMEAFRNYYNPLFDLNSIQGAAEQLHYPKLSEESLRLKIFFLFPLEQVTEMIF